MNYLEIRLKKESPQTGTCQLSKRKKTEVFTAQIPAGTPEITVSGEALLQEFRRIMLHQSTEEPLTGDPPPESVSTATSRSQGGGRGKSSSAG